MRFFCLFLFGQREGGGGGSDKAAGLELEVVLAHDFSIRARSTSLHQY